MTPHPAGGAGEGAAPGGCFGDHRDEWAPREEEFRAALVWEWAA
jgi:hypothetical protein